MSSTTNKPSAQGGFTLVVSALLVSLMLLTLAASAAGMLRAREGTDVAIDDHLQARASATSCLEVALLKRKLDPAYVGNESVSAGSVDCTIRPISAGETPTIETEAVADGATYRLRAQVDASDGFVVTRWERVAEF